MSTEAYTLKANTCIEEIGQQSWDRCANPARAGKKVGMVKSFIIQGINERLQNVCLAFQFLKNCRPILPGENLITHKAIVRGIVGTLKF